MEFVGARPSEDGKATLITIAMSPQDAERFMKAVAAGNLKHLLVTDARIESPESARALQKQWTQSEADRRTKPHDSSTPGEL